MTNQIHRLQEKYSSEIERFGISEVYIIEGRIKIKSQLSIPFELMRSIEHFLL